MDDELNDPTLAAIATGLQSYPDARFRARLRQDLERSVMTTQAPAARQAVIPYVVVQDIEPLIAFVKNVFDATEVNRAVGSAGGTHCELRIGDSVAMFGGNKPGTPAPPKLIAFHIYVDDVDAVYRRAIEAGATSMGEPAQMPYNERAGYIIDPAGNHWYIATHTGPTYFSKEPRTITPSLNIQETPGRGVNEFMAFVTAAFGIEVEARHEHEGKFRHGVLRVGDDFLELGVSESWALPAASMLILNVGDADAAYQRALQVGASSLMPPAKQPFGGRMAGVTDAWGNEWYLASS